jgi:hypothetical protein
LTVQSDPEILIWCLGVHNGNASDFLKSVADAAMRADWNNYPVLRPALLHFREKYPKYFNDQEDLESRYYR